VVHPQDSIHIYRFDIYTFKFEGAEDDTGILRSRDEVNKLIAQEITEDLPTNRIVVGGFSQGGAMSLATGLTTPHKLAGLAVLSGWFASREKIKEVRGDNLVLVTEILT
jgi:predicted esterase